MNYIRELRANLLPNLPKYYIRLDRYLLVRNTLGVPPSRESASTALMRDYGAEISEDEANKIITLWLAATRGIIVLDGGCDGPSLREVNWYV